MSGISCNRNKKNGKPNKFVNVPVLQVKSLKLDHNKPNTSEAKSNARSEDDLRQNRKPVISNANGKIGLKTEFSNVGDATDEPEACFVKRFRSLRVDNSGENAPCSSSNMNANISQNLAKGLDEAALIYGPAVGDPCENLEEQYASYKYYAGKHSKSIKFTNEVAVLYFNGEDTLCQSSEPLKKELDQQIRNKEMRKEHLMSKGQFDNVYLF